jgi:hypothetical protein
VTFLSHFPEPVPVAGWAAYVRWAQEQIRAQQGPHTDRQVPATEKDDDASRIKH